MLSGHTKPFAVLGHPIGHSLSPVMHNASFRALGLDAIYLAFDVHPDRLLPVLTAMQEMGFRGVNLTVPLKEVAFALFTELDDSARLLGAVNTVAFTEAGLKGYNTDGYGFLTAVDDAFGSVIRDASVFVLGTGGAGRAVALMCAIEGAGRITLADLDEARAVKLAAEIGAQAPGLDIQTADPRQCVPAVRAADLVIQSTPVGMKPDDPSLLAEDAFAEGQCVFDLIYMYPQTPFLRTAAAAGARVANGLGMLLHQGARAFTIWTGQAPDVEAMRSALEKAVYAA